MNEQLSNTKVVWILGLVIVVAVLALVGLRSYTDINLPFVTTPPASEPDSVENIEQELEDLNAGDLEAELQGIESDIEEL